MIQTGVWIKAFIGFLHLFCKLLSKQLFGKGKLIA